MDATLPGDDSEYHSVEYLLGFFLMVVWIVPFGFFISLAANESVLPGSGLAGANAGAPEASAADDAVGARTAPSGIGGRGRRASVVLQVLDFGKAQWERVFKKNVFPNGMPGSSYKERVL